MSAVQGNNEISMWNLETGFRQCVLWASPTPALSNTQVSYFNGYRFSKKSERSRKICDQFVTE